MIRMSTCSSTTRKGTKKRHPNGCPLFYVFDYPAMPGLLDRQNPLAASSGHCLR